MKSRTIFKIVLGAFLALELPAAQAVDVSLAGTAWTATGVAGLITGNYTTSPDDVQFGASPVGNARFGYVTTYGGVTGVSPLSLNDTDPGFNQTNGSRVVSGTFSATANAHLTLYFNYVSTDGRSYDDYAWARLVSASTHQTAAWLYTARSGNAPDNNGTGDYVPGKVLSEQVGYDALDSKDPNRKIAATLNDGNPVIGVASNNTYWAPLGGSYGWCWDVGTSCGHTGWVKSDYVVSVTGNYYLEVGVTNWGDEVYDSALAIDFAGLSQSGFGNAAVLDNALPVPEPENYALMLAGLGLMGFLVRRRNSRRD